MEKRLIDLNQNNSRNLIWTLEHEDIYTAGTSFRENEILNKSIKVIKTNRGGKSHIMGLGN